MVQKNKKQSPLWSINSWTWVPENAAGSFEHMHQSHTTGYPITKLGMKGIWISKTTRATRGSVMMLQYDIRWPKKNKDIHRRLHVKEHVYQIALFCSSNCLEWGGEDASTAASEVVLCVCKISVSGAQGRSPQLDRRCLGWRTPCRLILREALHLERLVGEARAIDHWD